VGISTPTPSSTDKPGYRSMQRHPRNDVVNGCCSLMWFTFGICLRDNLEPDRRYGIVWRIARTLSSSVICLSNEMAEQIDARVQGLFAQQTKVNWVYSSVNFDRMRPASQSEKTALRKDLGIDENEFAIIYVAGFYKKKGRLDFINKMAPMIKEHPQFRFHFIGDFDPRNDSYSRQCDELWFSLSNSDKFIFHGYQPATEQCYRAADCTVLASVREGMARCMIESIACGTPVVNFAVTSATEVLEKQNCGTVVEWGNYSQMPEGLLRLYESTQMRDQFSESGASESR